MIFNSITNLLSATPDNQNITEKLSATQCAAIVFGVVAFAAIIITLIILHFKAHENERKLNHDNNRTLEIIARNMPTTTDTQTLNVVISGNVTVLPTAQQKDGALPTTQPQPAQIEQPSPDEEKNEPEQNTKSEK